MSSLGIPRPEFEPKLMLTSTHIHQPIPISPPKCAQLEPSFICTICWQPQYPPSDQSTSTSRFGPKLLGSSARIVCQACWCAVLDLSICWVCGECIVRGDEVVSLGWCFWHRECFGCLICGTKIDPPAYDDEISRKRKWNTCDGGDDDIEEPTKQKRYPGVELEEIRLCAACDVDTSHEGQDTLLGNELENVTKCRRRLSPSRLESFSECQAELKVIPRQLARRPRRMKGATGIESELGRFINCSSTVSRNASEICFIEDRAPLLLRLSHSGISEDGTSEPRRGDLDEHTGDHTDPTRGQPTVYVSVFDPIGDTPFTPSPTKPLPIWMSFLPNNVQGDREKNERRYYDISPESRLSQEFIEADRSNQPSSSESAESSGSYDEIRTVHNLTPKLRSGSQAGPSAPIDIPRPKRRAATSIVFQQDDFKTHPRISRRSHTMGSTYSTPPEFSTKPTQYRKHPTPFPRAERSVNDHEEPSSYFNQSIDIISMVAHSPEVVAGVISLHGSPIQSPLSSPGRSALLTSSEYLACQSHAPPSLYRKYVAKEAEPIMERLKKQRSERRSKRSASDVVVKKEKSVVRFEG